MLKVHAKKLGTVVVLYLQGRVVTGETSPLRTTVNLQSDMSAVVLDLARVSMVDAAGLGVMLELREQAQSKGIDFKLTNVSKFVSRMLEITHLSSVFEIISEAEILFDSHSGAASAALALSP